MTQQPDPPAGIAEADLQVAYIAGPMPPCSIHERLYGMQVEAAYDAKTTFGPWAFLCPSCFVRHGIGLGTGRGQRLLPGPRPAGTEADR